MLKLPIYLDYSATTPVDWLARQPLLEMIAERWVGMAGSGWTRT